MVFGTEEIVALAILFGCLAGMLWLIWNYATRPEHDDGRARDDAAEDTPRNYTTPL